MIEVIAAFIFGWFAAPALNVLVGIITRAYISHVSTKRGGV